MRIRLNDIVVSIIIVILIIVMTYPLVFRFTTHIPGFFSTDESYAFIWDQWRIKYSSMHREPLEYTNLISYPFGVDFDPVKTGRIMNFWQRLNRILALHTDAPAAYNLQVLANFFLSAIITYLLVYYLTASRMPAIFSAIAFGFCPYQFIRSWQHLSLTYSQWLPLTLFALFLLRENNWKAKMLFFISAVLLFSFDYYVCYFTLVSVAVFLIYFIIYNLRLRRKAFQSNEIGRYASSIFLIFIIAFVVLLPQHYSFIKKLLSFSGSSPSAFNPYLRPFEDLFAQSAKPLSYLLPAVTHPLFGKFTERFLGSHLYGISFTEHTLYLGWVPLVLSFFAFKEWRKKKKAHRLSDNESFYIGFFLTLAIAAWFFSQPPRWNILSIKLYLPSFFMYKIVPMFRAYCRFGVVVMLAVSVLAGFGLKFILERFKSNKTKVAVTALFCCMVLFEFWNYPPLKVIDVSGAPGVYNWLKGMPQDLVISEYPLDTEGSNEMYKFYQTIHEKKIINGTIPGTYANRIAKTIAKLSKPETTGALRRMGVKYVLVHIEEYKKTELIEWIEELKDIPENPRLKFIRNFPSQGCPQRDIACTRESGPIDVYEVIAPPIKPQGNKNNL